MNFKVIIGNAAADGAVSPNGQFFEVTICDDPPREKDGSKNKRFVTVYQRCSLFIKEGMTPPTIKKGDRVFAEGWEGRRDWEDDKKGDGRKGTELELRCERIGHMRGRLADIIREGQADSPAPEQQAQAPTPKTPAKAGKVGGKPKF